MSFPAHISSLASHQSHQFVTKSWIQYAHATISAGPSTEIDPITKSIGLRLLDATMHGGWRSLGSLLLSPTPNHVLLGYCGLYSYLPARGDALLLEGLANAVRSGLSEGNTADSLIDSAALFNSSLSEATDKLEPVIWDFVRSSGRAGHMHKAHNITRDSWPAVNAIIERYVDSVPLHELSRMLDFRLETDQRDFIHIPGHIDGISPLRRRLVKRLLLEKALVGPRYNDANLQYSDHFLRIYLTMDDSVDIGKLRGRKMIRALQRMERELDPTRLP